MNFITKEILEKYIGDKTKIELKDLTQVIEEQFGYIVKLEKNDNTDEITKALSENPELIEKVKGAREKRDPEFTTYLRNRQEFNKFIKEVRNDG